MAISSVSAVSFGKNSNTKHNSLKITGYGAVAAGVASAAAGHYHKISAHKKLAALAGFFTLAHIFLIEKHRFLKK